jgi:hypothetical protein
MGNEDEQKSQSGIKKHNQYYQKHDAPKEAPTTCIKSFISVLIYGICIISLVLSFYLNYRQQNLELELKKLIYLDNKVNQIEVNLNEVIRKIAEISDRQIDNENVVVQEELLDLVDEPTIKKLPSNIFSDLHRLKRDVSTLKMARRQRQTAIQQSPNECLCPAGE